MLLPGTLSGKVLSFFHLWRTHSRYTLKNKPMNVCVGKAVRKLASSKVRLGSQARLRNQGHDLTSSCCLPLALYILNGRTRAWEQKQRKLAGKLSLLRGPALTDGSPWAIPLKCGNPVELTLSSERHDYVLQADPSQVCVRVCICV